MLLFSMPQCKDSLLGQVQAYPVTYGLHPTVSSRSFPLPRPHFSPLRDMIGAATLRTHRDVSVRSQEGSADNARSANKSVQQMLAELELLRMRVAARQGGEGGDEVAATEEASKLAADQAEQKKEAAELNRKLEEMMRKKRLENEERLTRAQAKRGLAGIKAITKHHSDKHRRMLKI